MVSRRLVGVCPTLGLLLAALAGAVTGLACGRSDSSTRQPSDQTTHSRLTTGGAASREQARAAEYAAHAAAYRRLAADNRQAAAALAADVSRQAEVAAETGVATTALRAETATATTVVAKAGSVGSIDDASIAPAAVQAKREAAAALTDRLAAAAQKAADFHAHKAAEIAAAAGGAK